MPDPITSNSRVINAYPWHQRNWKQFSTTKANQQLPHAILLVGEEGVGKLDLARRMAKSLICMTNTSTQDDACGQCQSCKTYESEANPDFMNITLLEDKQQIAVDQIRELSQFLNYSRSYNTARVVILSPAERMNPNAANSLLKSLEEPAAHTLIILVTSQLKQLLATIKSRCQIITVPKPSTETATQWLSDQQAGQKSAYDTDYLLAINQGKPLNTLNCSVEAIEEREDFLIDLQSVLQDKQSLTEIAKKWQKYNSEALLNWQITLLQMSIKQGMVFNQSNGNVHKSGGVYFGSAQQPNSTSSTELSFSSNSDSKIMLEAQRLTQNISLDALLPLYQQLLKEKQYIHTSVNSQMFVETMLMLWKKAM